MKKWQLKLAERTARNYKALKYLAGLNIGSCVDCPIYIMCSEKNWIKCYKHTGTKSKCVELLVEFCLIRANKFITVDNFLKKKWRVRP